MICDQCETVAHCTKHGCVPKQSAPVQEPVAWWIPKSKQFCLAKRDGSRPFKKAWEPLYTTPPAAPVQNSDHEFKNFHRVLCERFGYTHDEVDWKRDQVSLIEWIAKQVNPAAPVREPYAWHYKNAGGVSAWHFGPSRRFDADLDASERWPKTHQLIPVYTTPPAAQRQWVGLTDEEAEELRIEKEFDKWGISESAFKYAVRDIEAELKERNK